MPMNLIFAVVFCCVAILAISIAVLYKLFEKREDHLINALYQLVDDAKNDRLEISDYKDTTFSSLENELYHYLISLETSKEEIQHQKQVIQTLISDISHQCLTPISNIVLYSQIMEESNFHSKESRLITQQAEKLDFLIQSLVKMSRLESGTISPISREQTVAPLLSAIMEQFSSKAREKNISLHIREADNQAFFDFKWTNEALANIVDNAIKYSPDNNNIELFTESFSFFTKISVKDNGIGISEQEQNKIFQRFYRSEDVTDKQGVGIGLYLSRQIIEAQKGYIKLQSKKGEGTTFSIYLPKEEIYQQ